MIFGIPNEISGAIIGSASAGLIALYSVNRTNKAHEDREAKAEQAKLKSLISALISELKAIMKQYESGIGEIFNQEEHSHFKIQQNYFSVYETNVSLIGSLKNKALREEIVETYISMKGMIESLNIYSEEVRKKIWNVQLRRQGFIEQDSQTDHDNYIKLIDKNCTDYKNDIKPRNEEVIKKVKQLITLLEAEKLKESV